MSILKLFFCLQKNKKELSDKKIGYSESEIKMMIQEWEKFYEKYFHIIIDLSGIVLPVFVPGFTRLIIIIPGITVDCAWKVILKTNKTWTVNFRMNNQIIHDDRSAKNGAYAIWVRDENDMDFSYEKVSALEARERNILGQTFLERLIHGLKYYDEKGRHINQGGYSTLCSGTRMRVFRHLLSVPYIWECREDVFDFYCNEDWKSETFFIRQVIA